jgi:hypothetical protein
MAEAMPFRVVAQRRVRLGWRSANPHLRSEMWGTRVCGEDRCGPPAMDGKVRCVPPATTDIERSALQPSRGEPQSTKCGLHLVQIGYEAHSSVVCLEHIATQNEHAIRLINSRYMKSFVPQCTGEYICIL